MRYFHGHAGWPGWICALLLALGAGPVGAGTNGMLAVMGSSVPKGVGAGSTTYTNGSYVLGYAGLLTPVLESLGWSVTNTSTPGDTTALGLSRFGYLTPSSPRLVLLGYSLGNEGLPASVRPEGELEVYRSGLTQLIARCRASNYYPVVTVAYAHNQYGARAYDIIRQMNLLINEWDVPSVNLLGALDNGQGQWATGYWADDVHPNAAGHAEFFHAIVPTLFNAIAAGKTNRPSLAGTTNHVRITRDDTQAAPLQFTPGYTMHGFTLTFRVRASGTGTVAAVGLASGGTTSTVATVEMRADRLVYVSTNGQECPVAVDADGGRWHEVALVHAYARAESRLYVDGVASGAVTEQWAPVVFVLGGPGAGSGRPPGPATLDLQDVCLYRAPWTADEALAHHHGRLQQASMEICAPLNDAVLSAGGAVTNVAQSLSLLMVQGTNLAAQAGQAPAALLARTFTTSAVALGWLDTVTGETGYVVERRRTGQNEAWSNLVSLSAGVTQHTDYAVADGVAHDYRVCAQMGGMYGDYAGPVTARPGQDGQDFQAWRQQYFTPRGGTYLVDFNTSTATNYGGVTWNTVTSLTASTAYPLVNTLLVNEGYQLYLSDAFDTFRSNNGSPLADWAAPAQSTLFVSSNSATAVGEITLAGLHDRCQYDVTLFGRRGTSVAGFDYRAVYTVDGADPYVRAAVQTLTNAEVLLVPGVRPQAGRIVVEVAPADVPSGSPFAGISFLALEAHAPEDVFLVDFNTNANATVAGGPSWTSITSPTNPAPYSLRDAAGSTAAGITLVVTNKFTGYRDNNLGAYSSFAYPAEDTLYYGPAKLVFAGLATNRAYDFTFLARRGSLVGGFDYSGLYIFEGAPPAVTSVVDAATNRYCTRVTGLTPDSAGRITLTIATNAAGPAGTDFPVLNFIRLTRAPDSQAPLSGPDDDPDGDGVPNFAEYTLGRNPTNPEASAVTFSQVALAGAGTNLVAWFPQVASAQGVEYVAETTTNLLMPQWRQDEAVSQQVAVASGTNQTLQFERAVGESVLFLRVGTRPAGTTGVVHYTAPVACQRLRLGEGRNFIAASFGGGTGTLAGLLGTNRLPPGETESTATAVDLWSTATQTLTNRFWLSSAAGFEGWRRPSFAAADQQTVDTRDGLILTVRAGQGIQYPAMAGLVTTGRVETVVPAHGYAVLASAYPAEVSLAQSRLVESGWVGGDSLVSSDNVIFHNPATDLFDLKLWYDTAGGVWRNADASPATRMIKPGEAFVVRRRNRPASMVWTQSPPYSLP